MSRPLKIAVVSVFALAALLFIFYEIVMHSRMDAQVQFIKHTFEARMPLQLTGMVPLTSGFVPRPDAEAAWNKRSADEKAKLSETWVHALAVAVSAHDTAKEEGLPPTSVSLRNVTPTFRLDGWGRPFCLASVGGKIAAISSGLSNDAIPSCADWFKVPTIQFAQLRPKKLYILPSGYVLLFVN